MSLLQGGDVVRVAVQALSARDQFGATEEQVERVRVLWPVWIRVRIERTLTHWVARDVQEIAPELALCPLAQYSFILRGEVWLTTHVHAVQLENQFLCIDEVDLRDLLWHSRHLNAQQGEFSAVLFAEGAQDVGDDIAQSRHKRKVALDEAHLQVQANVLVEVTCRVVRLSAEDRAGLEDALGQRAAETTQHPSVQPQNSTTRRMTVHHDGLIQQCVNGRVDLALVERQRWRLLDGSDDLDVKLVKLHAAGCLCLIDDQPLDSDHAFDAESC